ncbi:hypothetical protein RGU70_14065 [Herbaspirillum sp. RTI4]|uniref:hypothetical protein n=1 Tax=Herbaspirillum sp. RTI4 TaxID=3048640 RepID=UPI002AB3B367|nr:hypothetical protein [Herbaspirillum sp. RTI4]MDY7579440.1 hypothetical protein [Herbaspirillum sp. RTI4]MEA9980354.1 hypothetical protein [Herbaspirillum sp. RTI4]
MTSTTKTKQSVNPSVPVQDPAMGFVPEQKAAPEPKAFHRAFSWIDGALPYDCDTEFAARILSLAQGLQVCAEIIYSDSLARSNGDAPTLNFRDTDCMMRFIPAAIEAMAGEADDILEFKRRRHA